MRDIYIYILYIYMHYAISVLSFMWSANIAVNNNLFLLPVNRLVGGPLRSYAILAQGEASDLRGPRVNLRSFGFSFSASWRQMMEHS